MANTVDELKALANTKLGFARPNRFLVTMPTSFSGSGGLLNGIVGLLTGGGGGASGRELNILCSNVRKLFNGVTVREFTFQFKMIPTSPEGRRNYTK